MPATAGRPAVQNKNAPTIVGAQFPTSITIRYSNSPVKEKDLLVVGQFESSESRVVSRRSPLVYHFFSVNAPQARPFILSGAKDLSVASARCLRPPL
jgi:hypothetical protein